MYTVLRVLMSKSVWKFIVWRVLWMEPWRQHTLSAYKIYKLFIFELDFITPNIVCNLEWTVLSMTVHFLLLYSNYYCNPATIKWSGQWRMISISDVKSGKHGWRQILLAVVIWGNTKTSPDCCEISCKGPRAHYEFEMKPSF